MSNDQLYVCYDCGRSGFNALRAMHRCGERGLRMLKDCPHGPVGERGKYPDLDVAVINVTGSGNPYTARAVKLGVTASSTSMRLSAAEACAAKVFGEGRFELKDVSSGTYLATRRSPAPHRGGREQGKDHDAGDEHDAKGDVGAAERHGGKVTRKAGGGQ